MPHLHHLKFKKKSDDFACGAIHKYKKNINAMLVLGTSRLTAESTVWVNCTLQPSNMRPGIIWTDTNLQEKSAKSVNTCKPPHAFTRFYFRAQFRGTDSLHMDVFELQEEAGVPRENPLRQGEHANCTKKPLHSRGFNHCTNEFALKPV